MRIAKSAIEPSWFILNNKRNNSNNEKTKEDQIEGYMQAVDKLLSIHDNQFRDLICMSNEG